MKFSWHGVTAALLGLLGVATSPAVTGMLPPKASAVLAAAGILYAAVSQPAIGAK